MVVCTAKPDKNKIIIKKWQGQTLEIRLFDPKYAMTWKNSSDIRYITSVMKQTSEWMHSQQSSKQSAEAKSA